MYEMDVAEIMCSCAVKYFVYNIYVKLNVDFKIELFFSEYLLLRKYSSVQTKFEITQKPGAMYEAILLFT